MGQQSFWDWENRQEKLSQKKPLLNRLNELIPWNEFRAILEPIYQKVRKSDAGRKPIDVIIMFKMLILQHLYNISDPEEENEMLKKGEILKAWEEKPRRLAQKDVDAR